jgi:hypothetical protein
MRTNPTGRPDWIDSVLLAFALIVGDAASLFVMNIFVPTSAGVCATYHNCVTEPHAEIRHTYVQMVIFTALVLVSLAFVLWRHRSAFILVALVQAAALALVLTKGFSAVHEQQHRLKHFPGCQYVICEP